jgi:type IV secretory pathway VirD2 relaxase
MPDDGDEIDWLGPAEFIFQTPVRTRKHGQRSQAKPKRRRAAVARKVLRVIRRRPEVMVKVTGSARGFKSLKEHLAYITRNGKLVAERENGERIQGSRNVRSVAEDWWSDDHKGRAGRRRDTVNLILSMPVGTDRGAVADAARAFARSEFAGRFDYLLAVHEDTDHPHVHLTIKTHGLQGQYLDPRKGDLQAWREVFAAALRKRGVNAEATPRRSRGVMRKGQRQAIRHMDARRGSRVTRWKLEQAIKAAQSGISINEDRPWIAAGRERQRKMKRAWATLAAAFEGAGQVAAAVEIKRFIADIPPARTEREALIEQARELLAEQAKSQGRKK